MRPIPFLSGLLVAAAMLLTSGAGLVRASSHMDAPLITLDPAANTTDVYAFVTGAPTEKRLVLALGVYPHQEPGIGPNKYNFDDEVLYEIHVSLGGDVALGKKTLTYQFDFTTTYQNEDTILQSFLAPIATIGDAGQNLIQTYTVTMIDHRTGVSTPLGGGTCPPNNQGIVTPLYNQGDDGENPAKRGVATSAELDPYTAQAISTLSDGSLVFAGQRDDGFFADIQSIFDGLSLRNPGEDSQGGFNLHMMALSVPVAAVEGDAQVIGVHATTSRLQLQVVRDTGNLNGDDNVDLGDALSLLNYLFGGGPPIVDNTEQVWVQVGRQGNPLFNEGFVSIVDKDLYSSSTPETDAANFSSYALNPELAALINAILLGGNSPEITMGRTDIAGIYIPDLIKLDLSTPPCRLAGAGPADPTNPDDGGFSPLSIFGGDVLLSAVQDPFQNGGFIPGGWPNGRRFGDDVVDIAVNAVLSDLRVLPPVINTFPPGDGVFANDTSFHKVFPYEGTPHNGRNHAHP